MEVTEFSDIRGFNYNPSYCTTLLEMWSEFSPEVWRVEIERGKRYFPEFNCLRIWLDFDSYLRDLSGFVANFAFVVDICADLGIRLMPTLFNRWHNTGGDFAYDFGGIYADYFMNERYKIFERYIHDVVSPFSDDDRIIMWDLCNEPRFSDMKDEIHKGELNWLNWTATQVRTLGATQPITVGTTFGINVETFEPICDVICFHPYKGWWDNGFEELCDWALGFAREKGKPLIANETCQGSLNDATRVEIIKKTLGSLETRGIGWCVWQLHGGKMVSSNRKNTDNNCRPGDDGYFAFIEPDGTLRPGHEIFNDF